jgi:amino acid transporter
MAFLTIRNFAFFGLFALPVFSLNIIYVLKWWSERKNNPIILTPEIKKVLFVVLVIIVFFFNFFTQSRIFLPLKSDLGTGLLPDVNKSIEFFEENSLSGPIFNNYDIGSFLIFHLFPKEKVFVDNRPEAYPATFFEEEYIPMQENEKIWEKLDNFYQFNIIFFYRHDATPWGQPFLIKRLEDPNWAPVFIDELTIIFLKDNPANQTIIENYQIPREYFQIIKTE